MVNERGARVGLLCHVERSGDISNHDRQEKSRNTGLETCVAHRLSSLCSVPDFRRCRKRFSTRSHVIAAVWLMDPALAEAIRLMPLLSEHSRC